MTAVPAEVAFSVADRGARDRVERAIARADLTGTAIASDRLVSECERRRPAALVYDLHPIGDGTARRFKSLKQRVAYLPVVIYPPTAPGIIELLAQCTRLPLVRAELQADAGDVARLSRALRGVIATAQDDRFLRLLDHPLRTCSALSLRFVRELVARLRRAADYDDMTVGAVAQELGTTSRTLERISAGSPLTPRELRDWIILLFIGYTRNDATSLAATAEQVGIDPQRFYRIRARLIGEGYTGLDAPAEFRITYEAFVQRCRTIRL